MRLHLHKPRLEWRDVAAGVFWCLIAIAVGAGFTLCAAKEAEFRHRMVVERLNP